MSEDKLLEIRDEIDDFVRDVINTRFLIAFYEMMSPLEKEQYKGLSKRHDDYLDETNDSIHARSGDYILATILHYMREGWK